MSTNIKSSHLKDLKKCNPNIDVGIDVGHEPNLDCNTIVFRRIYVCRGALKEGEIYWV